MRATIGEITLVGEGGGRAQDDHSTAPGRAGSAGCIRAESRATAVLRRDRATTFVRRPGNPPSSGGAGRADRGAGGDQPGLGAARVVRHRDLRGTPPSRATVLPGPP